MECVLEAVVMTRHESVRNRLHGWQQWLAISVWTGVQKPVRQGRGGVGVDVGARDVRGRA